MAAAGYAVMSAGSGMEMIPLRLEGVAGESVSVVAIPMFCLTSWLAHLQHPGNFQVTHLVMEF